MTREAFSMVPNVAPMNLTVFLIWGIWMAILTLVTVYSHYIHTLFMGYTIKAILASASFSWVFFFVLFWLGNYNMGLANLLTAAIALPWAWVELVITCWIANTLFKKHLFSGV